MMDLSSNGKLAKCLKIRTITAFISDAIDYTDAEKLSLQIEPVAKFLQQAQSLYEYEGKYRALPDLLTPIEHIFRFI